MTEQELNYYNNPGSKLEVETKGPTINPADAVVEEPTKTEATKVEAPKVEEAPKTEEAPKSEPPPYTPKPKTEEAPKTEETSKVEEGTKTESATDNGYEIEVDENSPLTDEDIDLVVKIAEEKGLTKEEADKLIKAKEDLYNRGITKIKNEAQETLSKMEAEVRRDPLFANPEREAETFRVIDLAIHKFGSDALGEKTRGYLKRDLDLLKFLHNVGKQFEEDSIIGKPAVNTVEASDNQLAKMYPEFYKK